MFRLFLLLIAMTCPFATEAKEYLVAFYSDFEPVCYSQDRDAGDTGFDIALGYEPDLVRAISEISGSDMTFKFTGVKEWDGIWLLPSTDKVDFAIGGISIDNQRFYDEQGRQVVETTHKTLDFKQSLLVRQEDQSIVQSHADLTCSFIAGAVRGTTGEYRYLVQAEIVNNLEEGLLAKGFMAVLSDRTIITSDGTLSVYDEALHDRIMLIPPDCSKPITRYFIAEDSMIPALQEGAIDAIARGEIGNSFVAENSNGLFAVTAIYSLECDRQKSVECPIGERAAFYLKAGNESLLEKLNGYIDYLTDNGKIGYAEWKSDHAIFSSRAKLYSKP